MMMMKTVWLWVESGIDAFLIQHVQIKLDSFSKRSFKMFLFLTEMEIAASLCQNPKKMQLWTMN